MAAPAASNLPLALKRARKAAGFSNAKAFLAALKEAEGSAPSYSTYAQWESGEVAPRDESLLPVRRYHETLGTWVETEDAPDLATALLALTAELGEMRRERQALAQKVEQLSAAVDQLVAADLDRRGSEGPSAHDAHRPTGAAGR